MRQLWFGGSVRPPSGALICWKDTEPGKLFALVVTVYHSKRIPKSAKGRGLWGRVKRDQLAASSCPIPVGSRGQHFLLLAPMCGNNMKKCQPGELSRASVLRVLLGVHHRGIADWPRDWPWPAASPALRLIPRARCPQGGKDSLIRRDVLRA